MSILHYIYLLVIGRKSQTIRGVWQMGYIKHDNVYDKHE